MGLQSNRLNKLSSDLELLECKFDKLKVGCDLDNIQGIVKDNYYRAVNNYLQKLEKC